MRCFRVNQVPDLVFALAALCAMVLSMWKLPLHLPLDSLCLQRHAQLTQRLKDLDPNTAKEYGRSVMSLQTRLDCAAFLQKGKRLGARMSLLAAQRMMTWMERDLRSLELGLDSVNARRGTVLKSHRSALDGRAQSYWLQVPRWYHGDKPFPLIVYLHYHGWHRPFQGYPLPRVREAIVVGPHGRGSTDFMFVGEREVLDVIEDVKRDYRIDEDRVYLMGGSMGGTGCWHLATHYPDRFAAIAPVSGNTNRRTWEEEWGWGARDDSPMQALRDRVEDMLDPISFAENLRHVPVFCAHGDEDPVVPVGHSRTMTTRLSEAGGDVTYREYAGTKHSNFPKALKRERVEWLLQHSRVRHPRRITHRAASLRHGKAYWLQILGFQRYDDFAEVEAVVVDSQLIRVTTGNVSRLALNLDEATRSALELHDGCEVEIDSHRLPLDAATATHVLSLVDGRWQSAPRPAPRLQKRRGLSGPVEDAFLDSFLVVYGTTAETEVEKEIVSREASHFASEWKRHYLAPCRIKADHRVTDVDIQRHNLILYGNEQANSVLARVADQLPLRVDSESVRWTTGEPNRQSPIANRQSDAGAKFCYPNPLNPDRYVVVFAATTWQGMFQINNRFGNWFKWSAYDNRNWFDFALFDDRTVGPETFLRVGFFGDDWSVNPDTTWEGVPEFRHRVVPRHTPAHTETPSGSQVFLSDVLPVTISQPKGTIQLDRSYNGGPLRLVDEPVEHGIGVRVPSSIAFPLDGRFSRFRASAGIDYEGEEEISDIRRKTETVQFRVYGDGRLLAEGPELDADDPSCDLQADVTGVRRLTLSASPKSSYLWHFGSAAWAEARVVRE